MTIFPKQNLFVLFLILDSLQNIVWTVLSVLWSPSEKYCGQSPKTTSFYEVGTCSDIYIYIYIGQSLRIICILDVPSNPKHKVDHFHALTPMSCDAPCINAMQVSLHVISCYMYTTCHMQHINHTLHVNFHG